MTDSKPASQAAPRAANKRGAARLAAVQALYQMDISGSGVLETVAEYETFRLGKEIDGEVYRDSDPQWFRSVLSGVVAQQRQLDSTIHANLVDGWPLSRLDTTLRAILRAAAWELKNKPDIPVAVVVSEYLDIARAFYEDGDEPRMVNAVVDRMAKSVRPAT